MYYKENNYREIISRLQALKFNILFKDYRKWLMGNLYIDVLASKKSGYASEMVHDNSLRYFNFDATTCIIPFFEENAQLVRGVITDGLMNSILHSWIEFKAFNENYVFDPALNILVLAKNYSEAFDTCEFIKIPASQIKNDLLFVLNNGEKTEDGFRIVPNSDDIFNSFFKTDMEIKGTSIKKRILMMHSRIKNDPLADQFYDKDIFI